MNLIEYLFIFIIILILVIIFLLWKIVSIGKHLNNISNALDDIIEGNDNRKILTMENDMTANICFKVNKVVADDKEKIIELKKSEKAYKQLLTSLSHDIRTPLTTLIGYLEAIHCNFVTDAEKDKCIGIACAKAYNLKDFIDIIFEWFKLNSKERTFSFENMDINELTRSIVADWIPSFRKKGIVFQVDISDFECNICLDKSAFVRILNNLIQNAFTHSCGDHIDIGVDANEKQVSILVSDNGKGIPEEKLPFIFDRLYKCDEARSYEGNGLGLAIVKELVKAHKGSITVSSIPNTITTFTVTLPINNKLC